MSDTGRKIQLCGTRGSADAYASVTFSTAAINPSTGLSSTTTNKPMRKDK